MRNHNIKKYKPKNSILGKYIAFYYDYELIDEEYFAFPSDNNVVVAFENSETFYLKNHLKVLKNSSKSPSFYALNKFSKPLFIKTSGKIKEFVVIFKPYGLAQFLQSSFYGNPFFKVPEFNTVLELYPQFFSYSTSRKIEIFETFLLEALSEKKDLNIVVKSIYLMRNTDVSIEYIAKQCNCSYKKLYRLYKIHCGTTPMVVKKNIRFRNALKRIKNKDLKLSDIAIDLGYYDQAIFNKAFKQLTGENPKQFLKNISVLSEKDMYFKTLK